MRIIISTGTGEGPTALSAFDAALLNAGVANYNLIYLSSIIPPGSTIERAQFVTPPDEYGHRLYVVGARHDQQEPEKEAWAGIGWTQNAEDGRGLFVEHHGTSRAEVETAICASLESMIASRDFAYGPIQFEIVGKKCHEKPVCALVVAVYKSEGWGS
jgi:arginine decarboxylase